MPRKSQLVCQQLENISGRALRTYHLIIRQYIRGQNGLYALYKRNRLYYVGLARNLRSRLRQHLRDRHKGLWDTFSVYLTIGDSHLKEMESLLLRIMKPPGNRQIGRFSRCENLKCRFKQDIRAFHEDEIYEVFGGKKRSKPGEPEERGPVLGKYRNRPRRLKGWFKGERFRAFIRKDGSIHFRRKNYNSPSLAAEAAVGHKKNGWSFWRYERGPGNWVRLRELRK